MGALCIPVFVWILSERLVKIKDFKIWHKKFPNPIIQIPLKTWVASHLIFFLQWLIYGYVTWLLIGVLKGGAFFSDNIMPGILKATFAFTLAWLIGFLILFIPGGLGVRELILTVLLGQFFNITEDQCLLVAIGLRILYSLAEMVWALGGISWKKELK